MFQFLILPEEFFDFVVSILPLQDAGFPSKNSTAWFEIRDKLCNMAPPELQVSWGRERVLVEKKKKDGTEKAVGSTQNSGGTLTHVHKVITTNRVLNETFLIFADMWEAGEISSTRSHKKPAPGQVIHIKADGTVQDRLFPFSSFNTLVGNMNESEQINMLMDVINKKITWETAKKVCVFVTMRDCGPCESYFVQMCVFVLIS
jgi:hypothetical protein